MMDSKREEKLLEATNVRARSNAALALAVHARVVPIQPLAAEHEGRQSPPRTRPGPLTARRLLLAIVQSAILAAAIAAPWILLLTS